LLEKQPASVDADLQADLSVQSFPNPVTNQVTLSVGIQKPQALVLAVVNNSGHIQQIIDKGHKSKGTFTYSVNCDGWSP